MTLFGRLKRALDALVGPDDAPRPTRQRRVAEHPDADRVERPPHEPLEPQFFVSHEPWGAETTRA